MTGGSGFLGSAICKGLVATGDEVVNLDDMSRGDQRRLAGVDGVRTRHGDVRVLADVVESASGCEVLWHLAAVNGTRHFYERPDVVLEVGLKGTLNAIDAALHAGCRRLVLFSSSEVYQTPPQVPTTEDVRLIIPDVHNPRLSYGGGKIAGELAALHIGQRRGLEVIIIRPHNIYGPDMGHEHVIPEFTKKLVTLRQTQSGPSYTLPIQGTGDETRAYCFIDDAVRGSLLAANRGTSGDIFHLGHDRETSIKELVSSMAAALDMTVRCQPGALRDGSTPRRLPDISKLKGLGYAPSISLTEGLAQTLPFYVEYAKSSGQRGAS